MHNYDQFKKLEVKYKDFLSKFRHVLSTKVEKNDNGQWAIWICYRKGITIQQKKEIATEMGDIPLKFTEEV
jgi:hypothetical protein